MGKIEKKFVAGQTLHASELNEVVQAVNEGFDDQDTKLTELRQEVGEKADIEDVSMIGHASGVAELFVNADQIKDVSVEGASSVTIRNTNMFEARRPSSSGYGCTLTNNGDGSFTINGTATSSANQFLNQLARTTADKPLSLHGKYTLQMEVLGGSIDKGTASSGTLFAWGFYDLNANVVTVYGNTETSSYTKEFDNANICIGCKYTAGVIYNQFRFRLNLVKGEDVKPFVKYIEPTTLTDLANVVEVANQYAPQIWMQTEPNATISVEYTFAKLNKYVEDEFKAVKAEMVDINSSLGRKVDALELDVNGYAWKKHVYVGYYNGTSWKNLSTYNFVLIPIKEGDVIQISSNSARSSILSSFNGVGNDIALSTLSKMNGGTPTWNKIASTTYVAGKDAKYVMVYTLWGNNVHPIDSILINSVDVWADNDITSRLKVADDRLDAIDGDNIITLNGGERHLKSVMNTICKTMDTSSTTGRLQFNLLYFSDIHGTSDGGKEEKAISRILEFRDKFSSKITDCLHGGDSVYTNNEQENTLEYPGAESILNTLGNHDVLQGNTFLSAQAGYEKIMANVVSQWGNVVYTPNLCYYYKDYAEQKVRLIVLDSMHWDDAQNTWFAGVLDSAKSAGLSVIACMHHCPTPSFTPINGCTFCSLYSTPGSTPVGNQPTDTLQNAIDGGLTFVCWLFGHTHLDFFGYVTSHPNQYCICVSKASGGYAGWEQDSYRTEGTRAYDCFNVISVDTSTGQLRIVRIGNNMDRLMRQKNYLTFDYINHEILANS